LVEREKPLVLHATDHDRRRYIEHLGEGFDVAQPESVQTPVMRWGNEGFRRETVRLVFELSIVR
jgi:hypothetical protein